MPPAKPPTFGPTVTLWPADPGEQPTVQRFDLRSEGDRLTWWGDSPSVEIPVDFVFREVLDVDVDDQAAVIAFVNAWGPMTRAGNASLDLLPINERGNLSVARSGEWRTDVQQYHLRALRGMARHWLAHVAGQPLAEAWTTEGFNMPPPQGSLTWEWWLQYLNAALSGFQMHVVMSDGGRQRRGIGLDARMPTLYEVAAWQLAAVASHGEEIRHCANDKCRRPFTRQRGRAKYGEGHATGVMYCSQLCAKAQAERMRRARRAIERKAEK